MPNIDIEQIKIREDVDFFILTVNYRHISHNEICTFIDELGKTLKQKGIYRKQSIIVTAANVDIKQLSEAEMNMNGWFRKEQL
jgi:hypothetical protein